jgi:hypothetical protein
MDFIIGCLLIWLVWGLTMLLLNSKDLSILAKNKFPITKIWQSFVYVPLWWLVCIVLIIIYPAFYIRGNLLKFHGLHFKNKEEQ